MSNFSITSNHYLRNLYQSDRSMVTKSARAQVSGTDRTKADAKALAKGIAGLSSYDYEGENSDEEKLDFYNTLKAFADTYNYTMESSQEIGDKETKALVKKFEELKEEHGEDLAKFGITFNDDGYMSIAQSAIDNINVNRFKEVFGSDTEFMENLSDLQKRLSRRVNYLV